jgi:hypothetical protein
VPSVDTLGPLSGMGISGTCGMTVVHCERTSKCAYCQSDKLTATKQKRATHRCAQPQLEVDPYNGNIHVSAGPGWSRERSVPPDEKADVEVYIHS